VDTRREATLDSAVALATRPFALKFGSPAALILIRPDGSEHGVHPLWLRERCKDAASIDPTSQQRLQDPSDFDPELRLIAVTQPAPGLLRVTFSDGHEASFATEELLAEAALAINSHDCPALQLWDSTLAGLPRARWRVDPPAAELLSWVESFLTLGFVLLEGVPTTPATVLEVAALFGFTRATNFGPLFDVRSTPEAVDLAYSAMALPPHTDNPYRTPVPGVQLLHCLRNETSGGLSTLVDGFAVAEDLRREQSQAFDILARTPVRFRFVEAGNEITASAPLIELDVSGEPRAIHFNTRLDYVPLLPPGELDGYFRARRELDRRVRSPQFQLRFLLNAGDLMMFDNCRLLHGRTGFDPAEGARHLQGCYIDIDGPRSLWRVLRRRLGGVTTDLRRSA
jgi:gamma-butyrobetaine dioxygenase